MHELPLIVRRFGVVDYHRAWRAMRSVTDARHAGSADEIWLLQHARVFTLGQAGRLEHVIAAGEIPVVKSDRGGQVTYHGPGQLVAYILFDLKRASMGVKRLVQGIEQAMIGVLEQAGLIGGRVAGAPGVYVNGRKIGAMGLRVRNGRSYHGLALNVDLDLEPFARIDPCGFDGLEVTSLKANGVGWTLEQTASRLIPNLAAQLGYDPAAVRWAAPSGLPGDRSDDVDYSVDGDVAMRRVSK
jgi:lipoyl(octanoyl) transferase